MNTCQVLNGFRDIQLFESTSAKALWMVIKKRNYLWLILF